MKPTKGFKKEIVLKNFGFVLIGLLFATLFSLWLDQISFPEATIILTYLLSVFVISIVVDGFFYAFLSSIFAVVLFNFLFTRPRYTLNVDSFDYWYTFAIMLLVSIITSVIIQKLRKEMITADKKEARINVLIDISRDFFQAINLNDALKAMADGLETYLKVGISISLQENAQDSLQHYLSDEQVQVNNHKIYQCMQQSETLKQQVSSSLMTYYFPIKSKTGSLGVLWLNHSNLIKNDIELIEACCGQLALALDRQYWINKQHESMIEIEKEKLRVQLLSGISHDLRTPLSTIIGTVQTIIDNRAHINDELLNNLLENVANDSKWLLDSVENILSLMRFQESSLLLDIQPSLVEEIVEETMSLFATTKTHYINVSMPEATILIDADSRMIVKVLVNLVQNAIKYSPVGSTIELNIFKKNANVCFEVVDEGVGLTDQEKLRVFDQFYSIKSKLKQQRQGLGLGLSICKTIIEAHQGTIRVLDNKPVGSKFVFSLRSKEDDHEKNTDN